LTELNTDNVHGDLLIEIQSLTGLSAADLQGSVHFSQLPRWDSILFMKLLVLAERRFKVRFSADEAVALKSLTDLVDCVRSKIGS
jgi:acyl carrier protein